MSASQAGPRLVLLINGPCLKFFQLCSELRLPFYQIKQPVCFSHVPLPCDLF